jgi:UDP-glucuronate 4-epimerase
MKILVTGAAGFIGAALCNRLLDRGDEIVGIDNLSPYYDVRLKRDRLANLESRSGFRFVQRDLADREATAALLRAERPQRVAHLAAQPGVRYSIERPDVYVDANLVGFMNILEAARRNPVEHFLYASSSAVYGANARTPFSERDPVDHPVSLYGATKRANELLAHSYSHLYGLPTTGLRYFTVYGPWGRPDMAPMLFTDAILSGKPLRLYNEGRNRRDFTFIDDAVAATVLTLDRAPVPRPESRDPGSPAAGTGPFRIYNVGNERPVEVLQFVEILEKHLGRTALREASAAQPGDMDATWCDAAALRADFGFSPSTSIDDGVAALVKWYLPYRAACA